MLYLMVKWPIHTLESLSIIMLVIKPFFLDHLSDLVSLFNLRLVRWLLNQAWLLIFCSFWALTVCRFNAIASSLWRKTIFSCQILEPSRSQIKNENNLWTFLRSVKESWIKCYTWGTLTSAAFETLFNSWSTQKEIGGCQFLPLQVRDL